MAAADDMRERILNGALEAFAIYGARRFSVSAVSERAGISRGTLYRYFPTKEDLLDALTAHMARDFPRFLHQRVNDPDDPIDEEQRIQLVAQAMLDYVEQTPILSQLLTAEPTFVCTFYNEQFPDLVRLVASQLVPPSKSKKNVKRPEVLAAAELLVRLAISYRVVGAEASLMTNGSFTATIADMMRHRPTSAASSPH